MTDLRVDIDATQASVLDALRALRAQPGAPAVLDLSPAAAGASQHRRPDLMTLAMLSNVLVTTERRRSIVLQIPQDDNLLRQFARAGVLFALAQRPGPSALHLVEADGTLFPSQPAWADLSAWRRNWTPEDSAFRQLVLTGAAKPSEPWALVQRGLVTFKNPHLAVERHRLTRELNTNLLRHWTPQVLDHYGVASGDGAELVLSVSAAVNELVLNFAVHPFGTIASAPPTGRDIPKDRQVGYVALYTTDGGGDASGNRLHVVVADGGHGIPATLRPKLPRRHPARTNTSDAELTRLLLEGGVPAYGRGEGRGFLRLVELARLHAGRLRLCTGAVDGTVGTVVASYDGQTDQVNAEGLGNIDIAGTIVRLSFVLPVASVAQEAPTADQSAFAV
ncbi:MAG TPA: hypothetical protein VM142_08215 [Acidimicrobiales bacterium]|nr:hypothetical protein [Acidimicrobiales bacterium]